MPWLAFGRLAKGAGLKGLPYQDKEFFSKASGDSIDFLVPDVVLPSANGMYPITATYAAHPAYFQLKLLQTAGVLTLRKAGRDQTSNSYFDLLQRRLPSVDGIDMEPTAHKKSMWEVGHLIPWNLNYLDPSKPVPEGSSGHWVLIVAQARAQTFQVYDSLSWDVHSEPYTTSLHIISSAYDDKTGLPHITWPVEVMRAAQQSDTLSCGWATALNMLHLIRDGRIQQAPPQKKDVKWFCNQLLELIMMNCSLYSFFID
jgi:hypothetical protein